VKYSRLGSSGQLKSVRDALEHTVGDGADIPTFEAGVVLDADTREQRHFLAP
jgi:hypothetical protein